ncbi:DUF4097 family beta strand repeat-containing protein [Streptomyces sp. BI20]|uniref:DUF4097 family beta strand repeat-containing protein n=1 Tax=Streptomyces sp. BI20 TaxID=3403460 RepID=UPI003C73B9AB
MRTFATTTAVSAVLDVPAGRIRLIAADRADTVVEVLPATPGKSRDVKAAERIEVGYADGVLRIRAAEAGNRVLGHSGAVEITVQLPAGSRVAVTAADAELRGVGRLGDVSFESAAGSVKLDEAAAARLVLQAGDVTAGRLTGDAEISTLKGDIRVTEAVRGTLRLNTGHGDIEVSAARGVAAALDAGTGHGRIHNALGTTGGAEVALTVHATTGYGDITARTA